MNGASRFFWASAAAFFLWCSDRSLAATDMWKRLADACERRAQRP